MPRANITCRRATCMAGQRRHSPLDIWGISRAKQPAQVRDFGDAAGLPSARKLHSACQHAPQGRVLAIGAIEQPAHLWTRRRAHATRTAPLAVHGDQARIDLDCPSVRRWPARPSGPDAILLAKRAQIGAPVHLVAAATRRPQSPRPSGSVRSTSAQTRVGSNGHGRAARHAARNEAKAPNP